MSCVVAPAHAVTSWRLCGPASRRAACLRGSCRRAIISAGAALAALSPPPPPHTHALLCPKLRGLAEHLAGEMAEQHIEGRTVTLKLKGTSFEVGRGMVGMRQGLTLAAQRLSFSHHCGQPAPALLVLRPDPSSGCPPPRVATGAHARRDARTLHLVGRRYAAAPHQAAAGAARSPFLPAHLPRAFARPGRVYARAHTSTAES